MNSDTEDFYFEFSSELIYIWMNKRTKPREIRKYCLLCSLHMLLACLKPTSNPYQNQNDSILLCSKTCPIEIESSKNGWEYQPSNGIASNVTWWARNRRCFEWSSVFTTSFGKHHCANWRGGRSQLKLLKVSNLKINALQPLHFQAYFLSYRIFQCPSISLPEVPPKLTCCGKIALDIVTGIVLPVTDEVTDLVSGIRYFL